MNRWRTLVFLLLTGVTVPACQPIAGGDPVRVTIPRGSSFRAVTDSLAAKDIVRAPGLFRLYARWTGADRRIQAGTYAFQRGASWPRVLEDLRLGRVLTQRVVIPEGWDLRRIAPILAQATNLPADSILDLLFDPATAQRYGVPGPTLEGYLYPATYNVPVDSPLDSIVGWLVVQYNRVWTPQRIARADSLDMDRREVVTLASIVEKEARQRDEMPLISAVYHNRLRIGMPLQADPTIQYAQGDHRARLLYADIDAVADHPYSTYHRQGLPPGPIASPSALAIDATLWPANADYLYFVARRDGSHIFTRTLADHNRARDTVRREAAAAGQSLPAGEVVGGTGTPGSSDSTP